MSILFLVIHYLRIVLLMLQKNKHNYHRGKDCILRVNTVNDLSRDLRKHAAKIVNYEKKEKIPLINEENKS